MQRCTNGSRKSKSPFRKRAGHPLIYACSIPSPTTRQAILRPLSVFRPAFRAISQTLSDIDLVFVEEAFERLMLDYDRVFSGECVKYDKDDGR